MYLRYSKSSSPLKMQNSLYGIRFYITIFLTEQKILKGKKRLHVYKDIECACKSFLYHNCCRFCSLYSLCCHTIMILNNDFNFCLNIYSYICFRDFSYFPLATINGHVNISGSFNCSYFLIIFVLVMLWYTKKNPFWRKKYSL